ncbi:MAG: hypothetical protein ACXWUG_18270 [Polyangiales bacterium]
MEPEVGDAHVTFVRALVAGSALLEAIPTIDRTMRAAHAFLERPCEETYGALQVAATDSYPFGPGDGCLAVPETGVDGCGCTSGVVDSGSICTPYRRHPTMTVAPDRRRRS